MSIFSRLFGRKNNLTVSSDIKKKDARSRNIAFVDTEVGLKDHKIHDIGALRYDGATFHQASKTALNNFLQERKVDYICGHSGGDARKLLNILDIITGAADGKVTITNQYVTDCLQQNIALYQ